MTYGTAYKMLDRMVEDGVYKKRKSKLNNGKVGWAYSLKK
jgi:predicted transcriptional regulator